MQAAILSTLVLRNALASAAGLSLMLLGGCVEGLRGIDALADAPNPAVRALARDARGGDKQAQLELGIILEEGVLAPRDWPAALHLYRKAARSSGGQQWIYTPNATSQGGQVMPYDSVRAEPGLPIARLRYQALLQRMRQ